MVWHHIGSTLLDPHIFDKPSFIQNEFQDMLNKLNLGTWRKEEIVKVKFFPNPGFEEMG